MANAGLTVFLLDIVPEGASDRNQLAKAAIERMQKASPSPFAHPSFSRRVSPGNLEDDLPALSQCDWIIEAVIERLDIKHQVYRTVDAVRKDGSVVSSNTSTLPLHALVEGMSERFRRDFMITHFFNPPRFMRLLELVTGPETNPAHVERIRDICDRQLGKGVVVAKDTPGFIANRIGCYWLVAGLVEALRLGIEVEAADAVMGRPVGIPKTGVFGLYDLIGIDLMPLIAKSMLATLPKSDDFCAIYDEPALIKRMIAEGYTGRKGKGGFYRLNKTPDGKKRKEVIDLKTGEYRPEQKASLASVEAAKGGLAVLLTHEDIGGRYARAVMTRTLAYAAQLMPEISDHVADVDAAMRMGYNWKYGPFELIDRLKHGETHGAAVLASMLQADGLPVPSMLTALGNQPIYREVSGKLEVAEHTGRYAPLVAPEGCWSLADIKRGQKPLLKNPSASLWDVGDGVLCLELTSKMNSIDPEILAMIPEALAEVQKRGAKGLMIGGDGDNFSVGANIGFLLYTSNIAAWDKIDGVLKAGQDAYMAMKYAPFPVVAAMHGMALGGGCEIIVHCDAVQAHIESYIGLVEVGVGVIPGWGGCKEMILRHAKAAGGPMPGLAKAFELISLAKVSGSAFEAQDFGTLRPQGGMDGISMNRARLLEDAKQRVLAMAEGYQPPEPPLLTLPGPSGKAALMMAVEGFQAKGQASAHDARIAAELAWVLTGGDEADPTQPVTEQQVLDLERAAFIRLLKTPETLARIEHMLNVGKPLRN
jgi:3-hydroxyacyl-CoA dehydrogenase